MLFVTLDPVLSYICLMSCDLLPCTFPTTHITRYLGFFLFSFLKHVFLCSFKVFFDRHQPAFHLLAFPYYASVLLVFSNPFLTLRSYPTSSRILHLPPQPSTSCRYGHIRTMAEHVAKGVEAAGCTPVVGACKLTFSIAPLFLLKSFYVVLIPRCPSYTFADLPGARDFAPGSLDQDARPAQG